MVITIIGILIALLLPARSGRAGGGPAGPVPQQPDPVGHRLAELRVGPQRAAAGHDRQARPDPQRRPGLPDELAGATAALHRGRQHLQARRLLRRRVRPEERGRPGDPHCAVGLPVLRRSATERVARRASRLRRFRPAGNFQRQQLCRLPQRRGGADRRQQQRRDVPQQPYQPEGRDGRHRAHDLRGRETGRPQDLGWMSGTRATLRNTGTPPDRQPESSRPAVERSGWWAAFESAHPPAATSCLATAGRSRSARKSSSRCSNNWAIAPTASCWNAVPPAATS